MIFLENKNITAYVSESIQKKHQISKNMKSAGSMIALALATIMSACTSNVSNLENHFVERSGNKLIWHDTQQPALFYGTNYTAPFAYAYRAIERKGTDHKVAINQDVYHMARLGFNAFRLHIWDVEITDSVGNLLNNEHLDLLDYLIYKVEERGMYVVLTLQTNFGNGYPEKDIPTGGYSYKYEKCSVHSDSMAQQAQINYVNALMKHVNKYTNRTYGTDYMTVGYEINNEPCHTGDPKVTNEYVKTMVSALRNVGCTRLIFYNASHNFPEHTAAYFNNTNIDGVTFQWYPTALVSNHARKGNFLPSVDHYAIPFDTLKGFDDVARIVYEFDPADNDYTILYPAMARSFRKAGMTWATQFAYDPTVIADCNTEYVTHYMNLAYTPGKAISQMIAAEVMRNTNIADYNKPYPADTIFGNCTLSYRNNLAVWNSTDKYYYTNNTTEAPTNVKQLTHIAGVGSSAIVEYDGTGAYFLDKINNGNWRLEVMPDVVRLRDAYKNTAENTPVATTEWSEHDIIIKLPDLGDTLTLSNLKPGVYALTANGIDTDTGKYNNIMVCNNIGMWEYVAPQPSADAHTASIATDESDIEFFSLPYWHGLSYLIEGDNICASYSPDNEPYNYIIRKRIETDATNKTDIRVDISDIGGLDSVIISAISADGIAFSKKIKASVGTKKIALSELSQSITPIIPRGWPTFVDTYFSTNTPLELKHIDFIDIATGDINNKANITLKEISVE